MHRLKYVNTCDDVKYTVCKRISKYISLNYNQQSRMFRDTRNDYIYYILMERLINLAKKLTIVFSLLTSTCLIRLSKQLPSFLDISNNCTIPTISHGLRSCPQIEGISYLHWWTDDPTIKCAIFVIEKLPRHYDRQSLYNTTFSYYTANNSHQTQTWLTIENPTRESESESFSYNTNGTSNVVTISDMLYYEENNGFISLNCPARSGDVPMSKYQYNLCRQENLVEVIVAKWRNKSDYISSHLLHRTNEKCRILYNNITHC
ncbi:hypothetical protein CHUAL_008820 [Chamberlinius hualienensis]